MYNIEFYEDSNGRSELWEFLESLRVKAATNKDARIQYKQISLYIQLLEEIQEIPKALICHWNLRKIQCCTLVYVLQVEIFILYT